MSTQTTDQKPKQANWPKRIIITLVILAPFLALLQWYIIIEMRGERELREALAELETRDPEWRMDDVMAARRTLADEENSALLVMKITGDGTGLNWLLPSGIPSKNLSDAMGEFELNENPDKATLELLKDELRIAENAVLLARMLAKMPFGRYPLQLEANVLKIDLSYQHRLRSAANLLRVDAISLALQGQYDQALESCIAALNTGRAIGDEPFIMSMMFRLSGRALCVTGAERVLGLGVASENSLAALQKSLMSDVEEPLLTAALRGERAALDMFLEAADNREIPYSDVYMLQSSIGAGFTGTIGRFENIFINLIGQFFSKSIKANRAALLKHLTDVIEVTKLPLAEQRKEMQRVSGRFRSNLRAYPRIMSLLAPSEHRILDSYHDNLVRTYCLIAALAAERFRLKHGRWPGSLEELRPEFLEEIPVDPYSGGPILMKRTEHGLTIYSVDQNGIDDDGKLGKRPIGRVSDTDLGVKIWDVEQRGIQPAREEPNGVSRDD